MVSSILKQTAGILRKQKNSKRWQKGFWCLAIAVVVGTVAILTMTGQALTHKTKVLNCRLEVHEHTDECYDEDDNLICGYADYVVHVHNDDCYDSEGNLVCTLPEIEEHEHTDECYEEQQVLICEEAEAAGTEGHVHTEECYETVETGEACDKEEHTHGDSCYEEMLTCNTEEHTHEKGCYDENGELVCGKEEHTHDGSCYESTLICDKEEHTHDDSCAGATEKVLKCGKEESEGAEGHTHTEECYRTEKVLTCGKLELHTHEQALAEDGGCYDESAFDEETGEFIEGSLPVCGLLQLEEHVHTEDCFDVVELTEDEIEHLNQTFIKTCEDENFKITAEYTAEAKIPAEAELIAEQISADSEHYAQREAEYKEKLEDENASMHALLKIGFYLNGEEIEPESDVTLTVQFLDENGLAEGSPITVVHFAEEGAEVLDGSEVENGSTTFRMDSFSEVAIGCRPSQNGGVYISQAFQYQDEAYAITFRVQGEAVPAEGEEPLPEGVTEIVSDEILPVVSDKDTPADEIGTTDSAEGSEDAMLPSEETEGEESTAAPVGEGKDAIQEEPGEETEVPEKTEEDSVEDSVQDVNPNEEAEAPEGESTNNEAVESDSVNPVEKLEFLLEQMAEDSEEYAAYAAYTENKDDGSQQIRLQVLKYSLSYDDIQLDLSECKITAEIKPTQNLIEFAKGGLSTAAFAADSEAEEGENQELMLSTLQMTDVAGVTELDSVIVDAQSENGTEAASEDTTIIIDIGNGETLAIDLTGTPNPHFSVQYYAWLDRANLMTTKPADDNETYKLWGKDRAVAKYLELIDTSKEGNNGVATLPKNGVTPNLVYLELENKSTGGKVKTESKLTKIYSDRTDFEYYKQPTIEYLNAAIVNTHYDLKEIWVLRDGKDASSTEKSDWKRYTYSENLHLTNRDDDTVAAEGSDSGYVYIKDNAVIRLVYDVTRKDDDPFDAAFYDYDISSNLKTESGYLEVAKGGINSTLPNGLNTGAYAFGNQNCGTAYGRVRWKGNLLNAGNGTDKEGAGVFRGCTFGLVQGMKASSEGGGITVAFSDGVTGPEIFGTTDLMGKSQYPGTLIFNRSGDTYTLDAAQGASGIYATGLSTFKHPVFGSTTYKHIWTNGTNGTNGTAGFWPMDKVQNYDIHFGSVNTPVWGIQEWTEKDKINGFDEAGKITPSSKKDLPTSDDGKDHNTFFGMTYAVDFQLVKDYEGPLEYYFFGDDDMWVFLDDTLVCDIGGVHSAVGEYVNLWDYLEVNKSDEPVTHTLRFFYTERGASGSTCWMQFTLPSVSSLTPETTSKNYGQLRIEKEVVKNTDGTIVPYDTGDEFVFAIKLTDANGSVRDDYAYTKYDAAGKELENNLVLRDGTAFTLKNGEYLVIDHLRAGTTYTIIEQDKVLEGTVGNKKLENSDYVYDTDITTIQITRDADGNLVTGSPTTDADTKTATGTIPAGGENQVKYTNEFQAYKLPKTGSTGTTDYVRIGALLALVAVVSCFGYISRKRYGRDE